MYDGIEEKGYLTFKIENHTDRRVDLYTPDSLKEEPLNESGTQSSSQ